MKKVAILTNFRDFNPGYSLTGIVADQVAMLNRYDYHVEVFVSEDFNPDDEHGNPFGRIAPVVPDGEMIDYKQAVLNGGSTAFKNRIKKFLLTMKDYDYVFTHDWIFTGWNLPFALALQEVAREGELEFVRWFHWIHSIPTAGRPWWRLKNYGPKHKIVYPNKTDSKDVAEAFKCDLDSILVIPHIKDIRSWFDFSEETCQIIDEFPSLLTADIVQVYPASTDRLTAKGVTKILTLMKLMKDQGYSVSMLVANQWATKRSTAEDLMMFYKIARRNKVKPHDEFEFTSVLGDKFDSGVSKRVLRELFLLANLFIFPTKEETFGLVGPEAGMSGAKLMVLNKSLRMMAEVHGMTGMYVDFGSFDINYRKRETKEYYTDLARVIVGKMQQNDAIQSATFYRQKYNMDYLFKRYYSSIMAASELW